MFMELVVALEMSVYGAYIAAGGELRVQNTKQLS